MKNATLKSMLFCAALATAGAADAQMTFQQQLDKWGIPAKCVNETTGEVVTDSVWRVHRATPFIADFNNDGLMDVYYSGTSCVNGWKSRGVLLQNTGNRQWEMFLKPVYETYTWEEPILDEDGEPVLDADGNPTFETKEGTREVTGIMDNGLPKSAYGVGSIPADINGDGLVDMIFANKGGNDTGTDGGIQIVKNLGNMQFRWMNYYDEDLRNLLARNAQDKDVNQGACISLVSAADYDKDGYVDLLVQYEQDGTSTYRNTRLLRNIKGERFEEVNVFKPLPFDQEVNKKNIYVKGEDVLDDVTGTTEPGSYTDEPTMKMHQMTNGHVYMVDLDGDTWPDILVSGWMDGEDASQNGNGEEQKGGWNFRIYRNCQDGTFEDKTLEVVANFKDNADLISEDQWNFDFLRANYGKDDVAIVPMDWNRDGTMDLLFLGSVEIQNGWKSSLVWCNYSNDEEGFVFEQENWKEKIIPTTGIVNHNSNFVDLNGDDDIDWFFGGGWMNNLAAESPSGDWFWGIMLSDGQGGVTLQRDQEAGYFAAEQTMALGDLDGDGKLDVIATNWGSEGDQVTISWNATEGLSVEAPDQPADLAATAEKGRIVMTWSPVNSSVNGLYVPYNVYCKNLETGHIRMLVPANLETGKQQAYPAFYNYLVRGDEPVYAFENLPKGSYEVGVQSVAYSYQASEFAKMTVDVTESGVSVAKTVASGMTLTVTVNGDNIIASSNESAAVAVFNAQGAQVATGVTNEAVNVKGHGVFFVKAGDKVVKVVK